MEKAAVLKTCVFQLPDVEANLKRDFATYEWPDGPADQEALLATHGPHIRGIATSSSGPVNEAMLQRLPALEIVSSWSAGREGIDVDAIRRRGIDFTDTSEILASDVADMAMALMLATMRRLVVADTYVRTGRWRSGRMAYSNRVSGRRIGIVGLGQIGRAIAKRAGSFGMEIAYMGPNQKPDVPYRYFRSAREIAEWSEVLVLSCAGGPATRHLVEKDVLAALGPEGWLINVARGSVVDQSALLTALRESRIRGAGLDVFENEPEVPQELVESDRVVLSPHHSSSTEETKLLQGAALLENLARRLSVPAGVRQ